MIYDYYRISHGPGPLPALYIVRFWRDAKYLGYEIVEEGQLASLLETLRVLGHKPILQRD